MLIARQAIFQRDMSVYGYELLFRSGFESIRFDGISASQTTATVLGGLYESGISQFVDDKRAFINCDEEFILSDSIELISPERIVVEVLENVVASEELILKLTTLKEKGYLIALDDFVNSKEVAPFLPLADIIKYDLMITPLDTIQTDVNTALKNKKILLAEKVESEEDFLQAKSMGFHLFQGFFFSKPSIIGNSQGGTLNNTLYTSLISELRKDEPSYQNLAEIIQTDVRFTYRILNISSKRAGMDTLNSIKKALMYMGLREIELWINILMMREVCEYKPIELLNLALIRSKFAEQIAIHSIYQKYKEEAFLLGLLSTIDAMFDQTFEQILTQLSLPASINQALIHGTGELMPIYSLIKHYEQGNWEAVDQTVSELHIDILTLVQGYVFSVNWAKDVISKI